MSDDHNQDAVSVIEKQKTSVRSGFCQKGGVVCDDHTTDYEDDHDGWDVRRATQKHDLPPHHKISSS